MKRISRKGFTMDQYLVNLFWAMCSNRSGTGAGGVITLQITPGSVSHCFLSPSDLQLTLFLVYRTVSDHKIFTFHLVLLSWRKQLTCWIASPINQSIYILSINQTWFLNGRRLFKRGHRTPFFRKLGANEFLLLYFFCSMSGRGEKKIKKGQKRSKTAKKKINLRLDGNRRTPPPPLDGN